MLAGVAGALVATDPDRATRLFTDAERIAQSAIDDGYSKASALAAIAEALAATDPDRAERIAQSITEESLKASALAGRRGGTGRHRPRPRRPGCSTDAERITQSTTDNGARRHRRWPPSRGRWPPPTPTAPNGPRRRLPCHRVDHRGVLQGIGAGCHREGTGRHRPRPRRTHRPVDRQASTRRHRRWPASRRRWPPPTPTAPPGCSPTPNASPSRSPARHESHRRWPPSRGHWPPPTPTAPNASPSRSPTSQKAPALAGVAEALAATDPDRAERIAQSITGEYSKASALATSRGRWPPPTPTAPPGSLQARNAQLSGSSTICRGRWPLRRLRKPGIRAEAGQP